MCKCSETEGCSSGGCRVNEGGAAPPKVGGVVRGADCAELMCFVQNFCFYSRGCEKR